MNLTGSDNQPEREKLIERQIGLWLAASGGALLLDQILKTGWLGLTILLASSAWFFIQSIRYKQAGLILAAGLFVGLCAGLHLFFGSILHLSSDERIGGAIIAGGGGFLFTAAGWYYARRKVQWWAIFVGWVIISVGIPFTAGTLAFLDFVFWIVSGIGSGLLIWGVGSRLFGLIIPGSIISSIGIGVHSAWSNAVSPNGLTETGVMLVWFALGWGTIIVFSRVITTRFVWWPLIPGGILAVVGWGLYSGGNPNNALSFIGNTGSIGVLIFGLYLLMLRKGMKG